jgi:hypothetical protein
MTDTTYASIDEAKAYLAGEDQRYDNDVRILDALNQASRAIDAHCGRIFYQEIDTAGTATARAYEPDSLGVVRCEDFWTTTGLVVKFDSAGDATYAQTIAAANYQLLPLNGISNGLRGWPYERLVPVGINWRNPSVRPSVQVTAKWGWENVPDPVKQSTLHLASSLFKLEHAPLGVVGVGDFGPVRAPADTLRYVKSLLSPYCRGSETCPVGAA